MKTDPNSILRSAERLSDLCMLELIERKVKLQDENLCNDPNCGFCNDFKKQIGRKNEV
jgi:hypothetical protein